MKAQIAVAALALASFAFVPAAMAEDPIAIVKYKCADNKTVDAAYYKDQVEIRLSDGRDVTLPQVEAGSGIRYANADESLVFWSKGEGAFVTEGDPNKPTYDNCVEEKK
jgi:membrane-bound inhibitor of C-type lysozyme